MSPAIRVLPEGFTYVAEFLSPDDEQRIVAELERLAYREVRMHGVVARRTVLHFGWDYDYEGWRIERAEEPPRWLADLRDRAAAVAKVEAAKLEQFLIARYPPGATIGWHRDAPMFGSPVVGVSLLSPCRLRFRRKRGADSQSALPAFSPAESRRHVDWETAAQLLEPRSLYVIDCDARREWQHHIPAAKGLRYSITMRTVVASTRRKSA
jgi:alkylated DNA repair dioxygenase AlkB